MSAEVTTGTVETGSGTLAYRSAGSGPTLLLLHGGWSDSREWKHQLEGLSDEFTVVAWDAPGCGRSSDPPPDITMAGYADAVAGLIDGLGRGPVHLCGLSFGGGLALAVVARHPRLVRSLVLASAYAGWAGSLPPEVVAERVAHVRSDATRPLEEVAAEHLAGMFASPVSGPTADGLLEMLRETRPAGWEPMLAALAGADLRDGLAAIDVPTLVLAAELDQRAPLAIAQDLHGRIPRSQLVVLPGVGHASNREDPVAFNGAVRAFLRASGA